MKNVVMSFINCLLILITVGIHKVIYRMLNLDYESLIVYWGSFMLIFFILNLIVNSIALMKKKTI